MHTRAVSNLHHTTAVPELNCVQMKRVSFPMCALPLPLRLECLLSLSHGQLHVLRYISIHATSVCCFHFGVCVCVCSTSCFPFCWLCLLVRGQDVGLPVLRLWVVLPLGVRQFRSALMGAHA